jgi:hypothetical protein
MSPLALRVTVAIAAILVVLVAWYRFDPVRRDRHVPWRQVLLWFFQVSCYLFYGHRFRGRELDLVQRMPLFRQPYLWVCSRCGAAAVREFDPRTG